MRLADIHLLRMNEIAQLGAVLTACLIRLRYGGKSYRLCIQVIGHPLVVLRDSYSSRCGCLAIVEETEPGDVDRICISDPC
jgi:hypothetical protein